MGSYKAIDDFFNTKSFDNEHDEYQLFLQDQHDYVLIAETLGCPGARIAYAHDEPDGMFLWQLNQEARAWFYFVAAKLIPTSHVSHMTNDRMRLVFAIMKGMTIDVGRIIRQGMRFVLRGTTTGGLPFGSLITDMCVVYEVPREKTDIVVPVKGKLTKARIARYPNASLVAPAAPPRRQGQRRRRESDDEDLDNQEDDSVPENVEEPMNVDVPLAIGGPIDRNMQYSHDMLRYIVQQNTITHNYLAAREAYEHNQVDQLNLLVAQWTLNREQNNYFAYPPPFQGMQDPPPPPPPSPYP